jgi:NAD(P)-dependent dehydrogenase (short-subunit alcohol dehydrogenase family)
MIKTDPSGKQALVTGSTSGIGYAIAKRLAEGGASVVVHGRTEEQVSNACARLSEDVPGIEFQGHVADLADAVAVKRLIEAFPHMEDFCAPIAFVSSSSVQANSRNWHAVGWSCITLKM